MLKSIHVKINQYLSKCIAAISSFARVDESKWNFWLWTFGLYCFGTGLGWFGLVLLKIFLHSSVRPPFSTPAHVVLVKVKPTHLFHQEFLTIELDLTQTASEMC